MLERSVEKKRWKDLLNRRVSRRVGMSCGKDVDKICCKDEVLKTHCKEVLKNVVKKLRTRKILEHHVKTCCFDKFPTCVEQVLFPGVKTLSDVTSTSWSVGLEDRLFWLPFHLCFSTL